jgi:peptidoglycan/xylan/chitin deacetylase (PgdA/CDA1 family)
VGMSTTLWDVDTQDWKRPGTDAITQTVLNNAHNGAIVLMHEGGGDRSQTVAALAQIIPALRLRGYTFVTLPQMIAAMGH